MTIQVERLTVQADAETKWGWQFGGNLSEETVDIHQHETPASANLLVHHLKQPDHAMRIDDLCRSVLAGLVGLFALACAAHAELDSADSSNRFSGGIGIRDRGMLDAGSLIISDFTFQLWEGEPDDEEPRLRLYLKDGFNSPSGAQATSTLVGPLPDTFAWTVTFPAAGGFGESSGLDLYNPPAAGGKYLPSWENIGSDGWEAQGSSDRTTPNFPGRIGVVPEPGVLILGLIGGLAVWVVRNRCKRT